MCPTVALALALALALPPAEPQPIPHPSPGRLQPDTVTFNAVLLAHANAADAEGAWKVLARVEETARADCPNARPDVVSFNTLLSACAKAGERGPEAYDHQHDEQREGRAHALRRAGKQARDRDGREH